MNMFEKIKTVEEVREEYWNKSIHLLLFAYYYTYKHVHNNYDKYQGGTLSNINELYYLIIK